MILIDTNVIVDALDDSQANHQWALKQIEQAVAVGGGGVSAVTLAELCAWERDPSGVEPDLKNWGLTFHDGNASVTAGISRIS